MSLYKQSELVAFLSSIGRRPNKGLSQNFLIDGNIVKKILQEADLTSNDFIIEIGPGPGVLTEALLEKGLPVLAIEKDHVYAEQLSRLDSKKTLEVIEDDFLNVDLLPYLKKAKAKNLTIKLLSNLPYHLTSPIMGKILPLYDYIDIVVVMLQKEVAVRMCSPPGSKEYGSFSIFTQFYSDPKYLFPVTCNCFFPKPNVTSAVIRCTLKKPDVSFDPDSFFNFIKMVFSKRRKMLVTILKEEMDPALLIDKLHKLGYNEQVRPEKITLFHFQEIFQLFIKKT